ncbi:MAG: hypothetical protein ACKVOW_05455 [Chitinophagaceae bacterium]
MKSTLLLPSQFKVIGIILLIPSLVLGLLFRFRDFTFNFLTLTRSHSFVNGKNINLDEQINLTDELALTGLIVGLLFIAFARLKQEDEFIHHTRLQSWQWSVLINYGLLLVATWLVHGFDYIDVMMYNMLTVLIIFIIRFHIVLFRNKRTES